MDLFLRSTSILYFLVNVSQQVGITIMDFTTDKEKKIEQDARNREKIGPSFDAIATALQEIGAAREYTIIDADPLWGTSEYDGRTHVIAHEIGKILNDAGGIDFMQCAYYRIKASGGDARDLERNWNGIGSWCG